MSDILLTPLAPEAVRAALTEPRCARLDAISSGRLAEHVQDVCNECAGQPVEVAVLHVITRCGKRPTEADAAAALAAYAVPAPAREPGGKYNAAPAPQHPCP